MASLTSNSAEVSGPLLTGSGKASVNKETILLALALVGMLIVAVFTNLDANLSIWPRSDDANSTTAGLPAGEQPTVAVQTFEQLSASDAEAKNAQRPLSDRPLEPAMPFHFPASMVNSLEWQRAVECLALANYYEAASEGPQGMRAVSQVVLNRVSHPAFPKSVCDVVFQGSDRSTGCQFTFTCDGSLARPAIPAIMDRARAIAVEALQGRVESSVGMATHYHTKQVVPYWSASLDKIKVLGAHIFYVWHGGWGSRSAFRGRYVGEMSAVADRFLGIQKADALPMIAAEAVSTQFGSGPQLREALVSKSVAPKRTFLVADEGAKALKIDETGHGSLIAQQLVHLSDERPSPLAK